MLATGASLTLRRRRHLAGSYRSRRMAASKSAVASLTKTLAIELAESGVNVNAIAPGVFSTDMSEPMVKDTRAARSC